MKKILLLIILLISCFTINVHAADKATLGINTVAAAPGSEVTVTVSLKDNPQFQNLSFFVPLNSLLVEYESCSVIGFSDASMKKCGLNPKNEVIFYAFLVSKNDDEFFNETGDVLNIKLKVKDGINEDVPLKLSNVTFSNTQKLEYNLVDGLIKTTGDIENKVVDSNDDLSNKVDKKKEKDVTWSSSNDDVAEVDKDGKVSFRDSGSTTITAKDKNGKIVYEKTYNVDKKKKQPIALYVGIGVVSLIIIVFIVLVCTKKIKIPKIKIKRKK